MNTSLQVWLFLSVPWLWCWTASLLTCSLLAPPSDSQYALQSSSFTLVSRAQIQAILLPTWLSPEDTLLVFFSQGSRLWLPISASWGRSIVLFASAQWDLWPKPFSFEHVVHEFFFLPPPCLSTVQSCFCTEVAGYCFTILLRLTWGCTAGLSGIPRSPTPWILFCHLLIKSFPVFSHSRSFN